MLPSPFGQRTSHPSTAPAIDYVEKGYDADLGLVRVGVRDYDPEINRFTTPDPLVLESPEKCQESPADCNLYGYARNSPATLVDRDGQAPTPIGHVYVIEARLGGDPHSYTGSTAQELRARFGSHEWKELIRAPGTKVTTYEVSGELNVAASGRGTLRSAKNEALRAAEQTVLRQVRGKPGTTVLNKIEAAAAGNAEQWEARHSVKLALGKAWTPAFAGFALLDVFNAYRDEKMSRYVMAPYVFQDDGGSFTVQEGSRWLVFSEYSKLYVEGPLAGKSVTIDKSEFTWFKKEGKALWGTVDGWGDFVPGLLMPELPEVSGRPERPEL